MSANTAPRPDQTIDQERTEPSTSSRSVHQRNSKAELAHLLAALLVADYRAYPPTVGSPGGHDRDE